MTSPIGSNDPTNLCPYLGMIENADSRANYATDAHRCYRLDNPTRIAAGHQETFCLGANHPNCPVYQGKGVGAGGAPPRAPAGAAAQKPAEPKAPAAPKPPRQTARPAPERPLQPGSIGSRARPGISMPVATIGLFALAVVVILLAFWISSIVGGDDDDGSISPADAQRTSLAARTPTPGASTPTTRPGTPSATPNAATRTAIGTGTAAATGTAGTATTTGTPAGGANSYTVQSGDFCGTIADANNLTLEQFLALNPTIDADCTNLQVGQQVRIR